MGEPSRIDQLRKLSQGLINLLDDAEPGLHTWQEAVRDQVKKIASFYDVPPTAHCPVCGKAFPVIDGRLQRHDNNEVRTDVQLPYDCAGGGLIDEVRALQEHWRVTNFQAPGPGFLQRVIDALTSLSTTIVTLEELRPVWAQGFSSDSMAAQVSHAALARLWRLLGVDNQTDAVARLSAPSMSRDEGDEPREVIECADGFVRNLEMLAAKQEPGILKAALSQAAHDIRILKSVAVPDPIPMVLHCPACSKQHIDASQPEIGWSNPPHRSHECLFCHFIWRPADVPTTGVQATQTHGSRDAG